MPNTVFPLTLDDFLESHDEKVERLMCDFKDVYAQCVCSENGPKTSNVYYNMEMINENADSSDTMKHVSELLLSTPSVHQSGYVVLVGNGKTYEHLINFMETH